MRGSRLLALALVVLVASPFAGCLELHVAHVPDRLLEGPGGNGWEKNLTASQANPVSSSGGFVKSQTLAYQDRESDQGYPGSFTVTSLRTLMRPGEESLRADIQERIRQEAEAKGLRIESGPATGTRQLANRAESFWFSYNASVATGGTFARNAQVKVYGEVFQCTAQRTVVVSIGLAQVTDVRTLGGVPVSTNRDETTWREIAGDPWGRIEGQRNSEGLGYNVQC